jgi:hypothetical protein
MAAMQIRLCKSGSINLRVGEDPAVPLPTAKSLTIPIGNRLTGIIVFALRTNGLMFRMMQ